MDGEVGKALPGVADLPSRCTTETNADATSDTVTRTLPEGEVPIEILLV
ncbi:MAG: hypothetical protein R3B99_03990 [Polyangiales bacterium]